jgi:hypothetical protein
MLTLRAAAGSLSPLRSDSVILSKKVLSFKFVSLKLVRKSLEFFGLFSVSV